MQIDMEIWCIQGKFVAEAMSAIAASTNVPVSVKCRIGVDDHDSYNELCKVLLLAFFVFSSWKDAKFGFNEYVLSSTFLKYCKNGVAAHHVYIWNTS